MTIKNKIILLIVSALLFGCTGGFCVYADDEVPIAEESLERAEMLRSLGVIYDLRDDETEDLTHTVSRAELAKIIVKFFGREHFYEALSKKPYIDVELTNEYARDIKTAKDLGFLPDMVKFRPSDEAKLDDAAEMIVRGLGYTYISEREVGSYAQQLRLFSGIGTKSGSASLDDIYKMLENALSAGLAEMENDSGRVIYKSSSEKTVLSENYGAEKKRGIVTANSLTSLTAAKGAAGEGQIEIGGRLYTLKYKPCDNYLGLTVDFYLSDADEVLYASVHSKNIVTEIDAADISSADNEQLSYTDASGRSKVQRLESNFDVIYNSKALSGYGNLSSIIPEEEGSVKAIDSDGNGKADTIIITAYEFYMTDDVYSADSLVYTSVGEVLDLSGEHSHVMIKKADGSTAAFAAIKKNSVLTVMRSKNADGEKMISVIVSDEKVTGAVNAKSEDTVTIGKDKYKALKSFLDKVSVGSVGTIYLTHSGKAAFYYEAEENEWKAALVYKLYKNEDEDDSVKITLYTPDNEFLNYTADRSVKVSPTAQLPSGASGEKALFGAIEAGEVIRYRVNGDGKINRIEKADEGNSSGGGYVNDQGLKTLGGGQSGFYWRNGIFDGKIVTDKDTLFFVAPPKSDWDNKDMFYTSADSVLKSNVYEYTYPYRAYAYGKSDVKYANIVVLSDIEVSASNIHTEAALYVVDSINQVVRDSGDVYNQLILYGNGEKSVYYCTDELLSEYALRKRDIIQLEADSTRKVRAVRKIVNADKGSAAAAVLVPGEKNSNGNSPSKDVLYSGLICCGTVTKKGGKYIEFKFVGDTDYIGLTERCKFTKMQSGERVGAAAAFEDVSVGDNFVAVISSGEVKHMVIIKK